MIHCLYYGSYANYDVTVEGEQWKSACQLHAAMYALGDKYDIAAVKDKAVYSFKMLSTRLPQHLINLIESAPIVYESTPDSDRSLRTVIVAKAIQSPSKLLDEDVKAAFQRVLIDIPNFNWDIHQYWIDLS